jgi:uncharacterized repeat protein (TIGR03803 family)
MKTSLLVLAAALLTSAAAVSVYAQVGTVQTLGTFERSRFSNLNAPALGSDGNLYTTSQAGGTGSGGAVIKVTPAGNATVLHQFNEQTEGVIPSQLVLGSDGALYGTLSGNGQTLDDSVFRITTDGTLTTVHSFPIPIEVGGHALAEGSDGNLYGSMLANNTLSLFELTDSGSMTMIHIFSAGEAAGSNAHLLLNSQDGCLYGMTAPGQAGYGCFFKISPTGGYTLLHVFSGGTDDGCANPSGYLAQDSQGSFFFPGSSCPGYADGTLSEINTQGDATILLALDDSDQNEEFYNVVSGGDGHLYGLLSLPAADGEPPAQGAIFQLSPAGNAFSQIATIEGLSAANFTEPAQPLVEAGEGIFYGVTSQTIFRAELYAVKPVVTISGPKKVIDEDGDHGSAEVVIERSDAPLSAALKVDLEFQGTAVNGHDYHQIKPTVTIPAGSAKVKIEVKALKLGLSHFKKTVQIRIKAPAHGAYTAGNPAKVKLTIIDNQ